MNIKRLTTAIAAGFMMAMAVPALAMAASTTKVVSPSNTQGFQFNPDVANTTPYEFTEAKQSIGEGSLYVEPISSTNPLAKFIASKPLGTPVSELQSVSYDFLIAGNGNAADADQFYLNVYTNLAGSSTFYDCRYDYVPTVGSTSEFTTATFQATDTPTSIGDRTTGGDSFVCPATLAALPAGSTIKAVVLNVGDTELTDAGLAGYLDNVVVNTTAGSTIYDFELKQVAATTKDDCKDGGWKTFQTVYKNQGDCVSFVASQGKAKGNPKEDTSVLTSLRSALGRLL